jgi:hypothetical protein
MVGEAWYKNQQNPMWRERSHMETTMSMDKKTEKSNQKSKTPPTDYLGKTGTKSEGELTEEELHRTTGGVHIPEPPPD